MQSDTCSMREFDSVPVAYQRVGEETPEPEIHVTSPDQCFLVTSSGDKDATRGKEDVWAVYPPDPVQGGNRGNGTVPELCSYPCSVPCALPVPFPSNNPRSLPSPVSPPGWIPGTSLDPGCPGDHPTPPGLDPAPGGSPQGGGPPPRFCKVGGLYPPQKTFLKVG